MRNVFTFFTTKTKRKMENWSPIDQNVFAIANRPNPNARKIYTFSLPAPRGAGYDDRARERSAAASPAVSPHAALTPDRVSENNSKHPTLGIGKVRQNCGTLVFAFLSHTYIAFSILRKSVKAIVGRSMWARESERSGN